MRIVLTGRTTIPVHCPGLSPLFLTLTKRPGVWGYSSHFGTAPALSVMGTRYIIQVISFHILAHSFALFCILKELNSLLFNRFRTLCPKTPAAWGVFSLFWNSRAYSSLRFHFQLSTFALPIPVPPFPLSRSSRSPPWSPSRFSSRANP